MTFFAIYLHPQTTATSKPAAQITFAGFSQPHFNQIRQRLTAVCGVISVHGGGYTPEVTVAAALSHIQTLAEANPL